MKIDIQAREFTAKPDLPGFITEKVAKLVRLYNEIISAEVCLTVERSGTNDNKCCEIKLIIPGNDLFASARCESFEEATVEAALRLERQIEKRKTKLSSKRAGIPVNPDF